ncbi:MAG: hypothetical protein DWI48_02750 [Chloroflexi bacterium]|nr:MAG: hypothetical protein DWI48_02750 [Chloroflexota bacterium]
MPASDAYERLQPATRAEWRRWLTKHHTSAPGVWIVSFKKGASGVSVPYEEIVQEALCFGWIDSRPLRIDEERHALLYTPRKPRSIWAASNKARVAVLIASGKMRPAGLAAIELAQANGSWDALTAIDANIEPEDLVAALKRNKLARKYWDAFPGGERRRIAYWITSAKRPETRAKRVEETVTLAAQNVRANVWVPKEQR